jgi:hypothetical protein
MKSRITEIIEAFLFGAGMGLLLFICLGASSCAPAKRVKTQAPIIDRPTWAAVEYTPGQFTIFLKGSSQLAEKEARESALQELCQAHKFICMGPEVAGKVIVVERRRK